MGASLTHPGPGQSIRPSHATVVGCVDSKNSKYIAVSRAQSCRLEMVKGMADMVADVLKKSIQYRKEMENNPNYVPQRVLFYRDGLSEAQLSECKNFEMPEIFRACDRMGIPRPKLTFVAVLKRHHIRFCPSPNGLSDGSGNVPSGLVVDRSITSPVDYDF